MAKNHHRTIIYPRRLFNVANWKITVFHTSSCLLSRNGPWLPVRKALEDPIKLAWPWRPRPGSHFPAKNRTSHGQFSIAMLPEGSQNGTHQEMPRLAIYWPFSKKKWSSYGKNEGCQLSGKKWKHDDHPLIFGLDPSHKNWENWLGLRPVVHGCGCSNAGAKGTIWAVAKGHGWPWMAMIFRERSVGWSKWGVYPKSWQVMAVVFGRSCWVLNMEMSNYDKPVDGME